MSNGILRKTQGVMLPHTATLQVPAAAGGAALTYGASESGNIGMGALGGALSGMGAGPLGMLAGAATGMFQAGTSAEQQAQQRQDSEDNQIAMATMPLRSFGKGGPGKEDPIPVQTEVHEVILSASGLLLDSAAKSEHVDMDSDTVTEVLLPDEFVFSNDSSSLFNYKKFAEQSLGYGTRPLVKSERGKQGKVKEIKLMGLPGMGRVPDYATPAEVADGIRKTFEVRGVDETKPRDPFTLEADKSNLTQRTEHLKRLAVIQERNKLPKGDARSAIDQMLYPEKAKPVILSRGGYVRTPSINPTGVGFDNYTPNVPQWGGMSASAFSGVPQVGAPLPLPTNATRLQEGFDNMQGNIDDASTLNDQDYLAGQQGFEDLTRKRKGLGVTSLGIGLTTLASQSSNYEPFLYQTGAEATRFPRISEAEVETQASRQNRGIGYIGDQVNAAGGNAATLGATLASVRASQIDGESNLRSRALEFNRRQDAAAAEDFNTKRNANRQSMAIAANRETADQNAKLGQAGQLGQGYSSFLANEATQSEAYQRQLDNQYQKNRLALLGQSGSLEARQIEMDMIRQQTADADARNQRALDEIIQGNIRSSMPPVNMGPPLPTKDPAPLSVGSPRSPLKIPPVNVTASSSSGDSAEPESELTFPDRYIPTPSIPPYEPVFGGNPSQPLATPGLLSPTGMLGYPLQNGFLNGNLNAVSPLQNSQAPAAVQTPAKAQPVRASMYASPLDSLTRSLGKNK